MVMFYKIDKHSHEMTRTFPTIQMRVGDKSFVILIDVMEQVGIFAYTQKGMVIT